MALKEITVAVCDWCGRIENAEPAGRQYNDTYYKYPDGWVESRLKNNVVFCPACAAKMKRANAEG